MSKGKGQGKLENSFTIMVFLLLGVEDEEHSVNVLSCTQSSKCLIHLPFFLITNEAKEVSLAPEERASGLVFPPGGAWAGTSLGGKTQLISRIHEFTC